MARTTLAVAVLLAGAACAAAQLAPPVVAPLTLANVTSCLALLEAMDVAKTAGGATAFCPTNAALDAYVARRMTAQFDGARLTKLLDILSYPNRVKQFRPLLERIAAYHVVGGALPTAAVAAGPNSLPTLLRVDDGVNPDPSRREVITVTKDVITNRVTVRGARPAPAAAGAAASVLASDLATGKAWPAARVHVIDQVLEAPRTYATLREYFTTTDDQATTWTFAWRFPQVKNASVQATFLAPDNAAWDALTTPPSWALNHPLAAIKADWIRKINLMLYSSVPVTPAGTFPGPDPLTYADIVSRGASQRWGTELFVGPHPRDERQFFYSHVKDGVIELNGGASPDNVVHLKVKPGSLNIYAGASMVHEVTGYPLFPAAMATRGDLISRPQ